MINTTSPPPFEMDTCQAFFRRVQAAEPAVRAWAWLDRGNGAQVWREAARGKVLSGVPVGIKDVIDVKGMPTGNGLADGACGPAVADAACVALLRQAGAVPVGKTVTAEMAYAHPGVTRNPWNPAHTPGGSSSGSAAAVASGMVPAALGTQTGGSVIRPAAYCGVVGFKPTRGAAPMNGITQVSASLDTLGWFTRDVSAARAIAQVLIPGLEERSCVALASLHVARLDAGHAKPQPEVLVLHDAAQRRLEAAGARVTPLNIQTEWDILTAAHRTVMLYEMGCSMGTDRRFSATLQQALKEGRDLPVSAWRGALDAARHSEERLLELLQGIDVVLTPSAAGGAPSGLAHTGESTFNRIWTLLGWPAIHLPVAWSSEGLPLGIQVVAKPGDDMRLLDIAQQLHGVLDCRAINSSDAPVRHQGRRPA